MSLQKTITIGPPCMLCGGSAKLRRWMVKFALSSQKRFFFLHSETVVAIRCLPSCQVAYLQLYVCAQYFLTADGKLSTRRTVVADWWGCDSTIFGLGLFVAILPGKLRNSPVPSPYAWGLVQISSWLSAGWYKFNEQCMSPLGPSRAYT